MEGTHFANVKISPIILKLLWGVFTGPAWLRNRDLGWRGGERQEASLKNMTACIKASFRRDEKK